MTTTRTLRIGSLFSGIGGLELGLERSGLGRVVWQVEIDPFRRSILAKYWSMVHRYVDVRECGSRNMSHVDVVCGGFPCQDVSDASRGRGGGIRGEKSGLWSEYARIVGEIRPRIVVVENVAQAARFRWLPTVRSDLHVLGYRTRALRVDARDVGAPHARARVFVVGYADAQGEPARSVDEEVAGVPEATGLGGHWRKPLPGTLRVVDGVPGRMDRARVRALGDAVVPDCAELVGRVILRDLSLHSEESNA